jgi:beta-glucosidase
LVPSFTGKAPAEDAQLILDYDIEGSDLEYRWNAREGHQALFPFGFGLSYTSFEAGSLESDGKSASLVVRNTGKRPGATVAQLYLVGRSGTPTRRLVGFQRVQLALGEARKVTLKIDRRILADWRDGGCIKPAGTYQFAIGEDAEHVGTSTDVNCRKADGLHKERAACEPAVKTRGITAN